jgi:hypothetical protein
MAINDNNCLINCIQINLQRSKTATANLCKTIEELNVDLDLVQEPYAINGKVFGFPLKYKVLYKASSDSPKTAIVVANKLIQTVFIQTFSNNYLTIVLCEFRAKTIAFFDIYCSPFQDINSELNQLQIAINELKPNCYVISADTNAHSRVWHNNHEDLRGDIINDFIAINNLFLLNENTFGPTYESGAGSSTIDLTLINMNCNNFINNWRILDIDSFSDHKYISYELSENNNRSEFYSTLRYCTKKANWEAFSNDIITISGYWKAELSHIRSEEELNFFVNNFIEKVIEICDKTIPKVNRNAINRKANKWCTPELTALTREPSQLLV